MKKNDLLAAIESTKTRSAWERGVKEYAVELVENLDADDIPECRRDLEKLLLSGAETWGDYSWGGCSLIYNQDIAHRLCSPSELRRTRNAQAKRQRAVARYSGARSLPCKQPYLSANLTKRTVSAGGAFRGSTPRLAFI